MPEGFHHPQPAEAAHRWEESARRSAQAYAALDDFIARSRRMVRSCPPSTVPAVMRVLLEIARLEAGRSTSNVAHAGLGPAERRARILELAREVGDLDGKTG